MSTHIPLPSNTISRMSYPKIQPKSNIMSMILLEH